MQHLFQPFAIIASKASAIPLLSGSPSSFVTLLHHFQFCNVAPKHLLLPPIMNIYNFSTYLFDMDGVIVDSNPQHKIAFQQFLATKNVDCTDDFFNDHIAGSNNIDVVKLILGNDVSAEIITAWANEKEALFRVIYEPYMQPLKGLIPFLDKLKSLNKKLAVCTSAPIENLDFLLDGLDIRKYFDITLCEKDVTKHKPNPDVYLKALSMLNETANNAVVFEDSFKGASAGIAAGCQVVIINNANLAGSEYASCLVDFTSL
jgi:beta-phosphoglucomutase